MRHRPFLRVYLLLAATAFAGCGSDSAATESTGERFEPSAFGEWLKFEPEGAVCANYESCAGGGPFNTDCIMEGPDAECIRDD